MFYKFFLLLFFLNNFINCNTNECTNKEKCSECFQEPGCAWCTKFDLNKPHCFEETIIETECPFKNIIFTKPQHIIIKNDELQIESKTKIVQIKPQVVNLTLGKGEEFKLKFQISLAHNFPIDLYYLMDLSASMLVYKKNLANLGSTLVTTMRNITGDFKLGFGSFVDKVTTPFASLVPERLENPCKYESTCARAYSFKNHMKLSNGEDFARLVNDTSVSGNVDIPEGGLDALMQVMVCNDTIGWRDNARRIIVFSTDAPFHIAGDGKLAGIVEPNDATCHMENNEYTDSLVYDYPSISLIKHIVKTKNMNIFFIIVNNETVVNRYNVLKSELENSDVGKLTEHNTDIIKLITDFNKGLQDTFKIYNEKKDGVEIKYTSKSEHCTDGKTCKNVPLGKTLDFEVIIKPSSCKKQQILIKTNAFDETLTLNLKILCNCNCEQETKNSSDRCNNEGQEKCGICSCNKGFSGKSCECKENEYYSGSNKTCINGNDTEICSGMGECKCGICQCDERLNPKEIIYGKFCECDNYSCLKSADEKLCSGNGDCKCGRCDCYEGWKDERCSCSTSNDLCMNNGATCNNKGQCECGVCKCHAGYFGQYCEDCPNCSKCDDLKRCVECQVSEFSNTEGNCSDCSISISKVEIIDDVDDDEIKVCRFPKDDCILIFKYNYNNVNAIEAESSLRCEKINLLVLVLSLIGGILLTGILTLILWKVYTHNIDKRDFVKFLVQYEQSKWNNEINPLFKPPVSNFENPIYGRESIINKTKEESK